MDPHLISLPKRLMFKVDQDVMLHLAQSCCSTGVERNYIFSKLGRFISNTKVAYMFISHQTLNKEKGNTYDKLMSYVQQTKDIAYTILWDIPIKQSEADPMSSLPSKICSHTKIDNNNNLEKDHSEEIGMEDLVNYARNFQETSRVPKASNIFIGIAWALKQELRYFKLFPEVVHLDGTSHTLKEKFHLLTFSVRTSTNHQVIFLRAWIPNLKQSTFEWVFHHIFAKLVPQCYLDRVRLVMGDGDRQQGSEVDYSNASFLKNARSASCGWHIVHGGWLSHSPSLRGFPSSQKGWVKKFFNHIKGWIYSWMRPNFCETEEEYQVSRALLNAYIRSTTASNTPLLMTPLTPLTSLTPPVAGRILTPFWVAHWMTPLALLVVGNDMTPLVVDNETTPLMPLVAGEKLTPLTPLTSFVVGDPLTPLTSLTLLGNLMIAFTPLVVEAAMTLWTPMVLEDVLA